MNWDEAIRLIRAGHDAEYVLDLKSATDDEDFRAFMLAEFGADALAKHDARMKDIVSGVHHAGMLWHSISATQRWALQEAAQHGGRFERVGKVYRHRDRHQPFRPLYAATFRNLCERDLFAWDGTAFDPEAAVVITERGRFLVAHGSTRPKL